MIHSNGVTPGASTLTSEPFTFSWKVIFTTVVRWRIAWCYLSVQSFIATIIVKRALHRQEVLAKCERVLGLGMGF
jgi:hypothetical protein